MDKLKELQYLSLVSKVTTGKDLVVRLLMHDNPYYDLLPRTPATVNQLQACFRSRRSESGPKFMQRIQRAVVLVDNVYLAELENNMGISEKTISEYIIDQAKTLRSSKEFTKVLACSLSAL